MWYPYDFKKPFRLNIYKLEFYFSLFESLEQFKGDSTFMKVFSDRIIIMYGYNSVKWELFKTT